MGKLTAAVEAAEAGTKAASLSAELQEMFVKFKNKCLAAMEGGWKGLTPAALQAAQEDWNREAEKLTGSTAELGHVLNKNVNGILEVDDIFSTKLGSYRT